MKRLFILFFVVLFLSACGSSASNITTNEVVTAFQDAKLTVEEPREMTKDDYGIAPMLASEGKIIGLGNGMNARIFSFDKKEDLEQTKAFYDDLGKGSAAFFSWTAEHKNILVQLNGDLEEEEFNKYKSALEGL